MNIRELENIIDQNREQDTIQQELVKTTIYVIYTLEELINMGLITGKKILTRKGQLAGNRLIKSGWTPDQELQLRVLQAISSGQLFPQEEDENEG